MSNNIRINPGAGPTFVFLYMDDIQLNSSLLKLIMIENHLINDKIIVFLKQQISFLIIDLKTGFEQFRFDSGGKLHTHKNDLGKPSETAYQAYYKDYIAKVFPDLIFQDFNLSGVVNHIAINEKEQFLKGSYYYVGRRKANLFHIQKQADIRFLKKHVGTVATDKKEWITVARPQVFLLPFQ